MALEPVDRHLLVRGVPVWRVRSAALAAELPRRSLGVDAVTTEQGAITAQEGAREVGALLLAPLVTVPGSSDGGGLPPRSVRWAPYNHYV